MHLVLIEFDQRWLFPRLLGPLTDGDSFWPMRSVATESSEGDASSSLELGLIIDTAGQLLDTEGPEAMTLTRVAELLGVTQPALYRHVDGRAGMWRVIGLSTRERLAERLALASVGRTGPDAVAAIANEWRAFGLQHPGRYQSADRHAVSGDEQLEAAVHRTVEVLELSLRGFGLDPQDLPHAAHTLRSALHGFVSYELGHGNPASLDLGESLDHLVDHLCTSFQAKGTAA